MEDIILVGYGGHARSVADCVERMEKYRIVGYTDTEPYDSKYIYLGTDEYLEKYRSDGIENVVICIGYMGKGNLRETLYEKLKRMGFLFPIIADPSAIISKSATLEEGVFIGKSAIINAGAKVEKMCLVNTKALVEHDCYIESYSHVAVGAVLCGGVHIGRSSFIGANATVIQGMELPDRSFIPAGLTIRKDTKNNGI